MAELVPSGAGEVKLGILLGVRTDGVNRNPTKTAGILVSKKHGERSAWIQIGDITLVVVERGPSLRTIRRHSQGAIKDNLHTLLDLNPLAHLYDVVLSKKMQRKKKKREKKKIKKNSCIGEGLKDGHRPICNFR